MDERKSFCSILQQIDHFITTPYLGLGGCLSVSQPTSGHPEPVAEETDNHPRSHLVRKQPTAFEMWEETGVLGENPCSPGKKTQVGLPIEPSMYNSYRCTPDCAFIQVSPAPQ
ncbi:uncharacterized protein LOC144198217 isoform X2 [Stigmatopora nigra]